MEILKRILLDRFWERWLYFSLKLYPVVSSQEGFRPWNFSHLSMNFGLFQKAAGHLLVFFIVRFLVRALHHAIFEWFNRQLAWRAAPMIRLLQIPVKWVVDNRALSLAVGAGCYLLPCDLVGVSNPMLVANEHQEELDGCMISIQSIWPAVFLGRTAKDIVRHVLFPAGWRALPEDVHQPIQILTVTRLVQSCRRK